MTLPPDAGLEDVIPTLANPERWVADVLFSLHRCTKEHGNAQARIGITGRGVAPFYRVDFVDEEGEPHLYGSFAGRTAGEGIETHDAHWSTRAISYGEVQAALGKLRAKS